MSWNDRDLDDQFGRPVYPNKTNEEEEEKVCGWGEGTAMQQAEGSMARQINSTKQSLRLIAQSEEMGIAAAQELEEQGEQLDNIESKLDKVNSDVRATQKHLDSIKSVFGGLKNWFTGANKKAEEDTKKTEIASKQRIERKHDESNKLQRTLNEQQSSHQSQLKSNDRMFETDHPLAKQEEALNENLGKSVIYAIKLLLHLKNNWHRLK